MIAALATSQGAIIAHAALGTLAKSVTKSSLTLTLLLFSIGTGIATAAAFNIGVGGTDILTALNQRTTIGLALALS